MEKSGFSCTAGAVILEKNLTFSQTIKHRVTVYPNSTSRSIPKGIENICPYKNLYMNVYSSIVHKSRKMKATQR